MFPESEFPETARAIRDGVEKQLHTGVQIYVSRQCTPLIDAGLGEAIPGTPVTPATIMPWRSAGKPLTALLVLRAVESGRIHLSLPLREVLPEASRTWLANTTIYNLLTHQTGIPSTETGWPHTDWSQTISRILHDPSPLNYGESAYSPQHNWFILGEILNKIAPHALSSDFPSILNSDLLKPLGMVNTSCGVSDENVVNAGQRLPILYEREQGRLVRSSYGSGVWLKQPSPGGNVRGPIRELGLFYEMMLRGGLTADGQRVVAEATIKNMTDRHRVGKFDETLRHVVDFGLGVICDSNSYGSDTVPYGFGKFCSSSTFGHGGAQCSMGFCDTVNSLVVAWSANGFCGEPQHQRRNRTLNEAIYRDLGLA